MLREIDNQAFKRKFPLDPHPFISGHFIELNKCKVEKVVRLVDDNDGNGIGFIAGIRDHVLISPFSAPFGGFHFKHEILYIGEIDSFLTALQIYLKSEHLKRVEIILPPDIYNPSFNAKTISSLIRCGFTPSMPEITNWVDLSLFEERFKQKNSREYYGQAVRNGLSFSFVNDPEERALVYDLICVNRAKHNRPIYMTLNDIEKTGEIWPVDYFKVSTRDDNIVASAIFYRSHPEICYAVFWGDNEMGRPLRAMDFLVFNLYTFYKQKQYRYIDLGISTEAGIPNDGLLRFKESHDAISSLRYKFFWEV